jgi:hypothetical protein
LPLKKKVKEPIKGINVLIKNSSCKWEFEREKCGLEVN